MRRLCAPLLISGMLLIFLISMVVGMWQSGLNPTLDKIPVQVQVLELSDRPNQYHSDGRPRFYDLEGYKENKIYTYYKVLYRGELNNGEVVEFWQWVEYEEYQDALDYLNAQGEYNG